MKVQKFLNLQLYLHMYHMYLILKLAKDLKINLTDKEIEEFLKYLNNFDKEMEELFKVNINSKI